MWLDETSRDCDGDYVRSSLPEGTPEGWVAPVKRNAADSQEKRKVQNVELGGEAEQESRKVNERVFPSGITVSIVGLRRFDGHRLTET